MTKLLTPADVLAFVPTADDLSRGSRFWRARAAHLRGVFTRTVGDAELQNVLSCGDIARRIANACPTSGPCSRECVGR